MANHIKAITTDVHVVIEASALGRSVKEALDANVEHLPRWQHAAASGDPAGHFLMGRCFEEGVGVESDWITAMAHYRAASEQGDPLGHFALARMLEQGRGVDPDEARARVLYDRAAQAGLSLAQVNLSLMLQQGRGGDRQSTTALSWMQKAAQDGNRVAQCNLGVMLEAGEGITRDLHQAHHWYSLAAEAGYGPACFCLGLLYQEGHGVTADMDAARTWFERGAQLGDTGAQFMLGVSLLESEGEDGDAAAGAQWIRTAAIQGDADAAWRYGLCLMTGQGIDAHPEEGLRWLRRAANHGQVDALYALGVAYARGDGAPKDMHASLEWFTKARKAGHPQAADAEQAAKAAIKAHRPVERAQGLTTLLADESVPPSRWQIEAAHVMDMASKSTTEIVSAMMVHLLPALSLEDPARAHFAALLCGALVEQGADPEPAAHLLAERLTLSVEAIDSAVKLMEALDPIDDAELHAAQVERRLEALREARPDVIHTWDHLDALCRAVVTVCSAFEPLRDDLLGRDSLCARMDAARSFHKGLRDIMRLLEAPRRRPIRVVWERSVFELEITGVVDLFQLHVLLADALGGGDDEEDEDEPPLMPASVVATAQGNGPQHTDETVDGVFDLYGWRALPEVLHGHQVSHRFWLMHESALDAVPAFEGVPTLILAPASIVRAWKNVRYFERLAAGIDTLKPLPPAEAEALIDRIVQASSIKH
ncbi:MAG: hypothetical protein ACE366_26610 [Bradymonadia bacterium]